MRRHRARPVSHFAATPGKRQPVLQFDAHRPEQVANHPSIDPCGGGRHASSVTLSTNRLQISKTQFSCAVSKRDYIWFTHLECTVKHQEFFMFKAAIKMALALTVIAGMSAASSAQSIIGSPMAGSAGAGNSAINGIAPGPANLGIRSDPSGVRNAARVAAPPQPSISVPTITPYH
jgi:hypothetical protein